MQAGYPDGFVIASKPAVHFGVGAVGELPAVVRAAGADHVVVVTDAVLAATPVIATVMAVLADAGLPARLFSGVHPNPTTVDIAAGAEAVAKSAAEAAAAASASASAAAVTAMLKASAPSAGLAPAAARIALVAVGGGSPMDAAKGIAIAGDFAVPALPIVAVPTTAGTGAETSAFGVVTDPAAQRTVYVGHASSMPAAAILDPALTAGLPPAATAATGMDALTHALESYLSVRANPWSAGLALQVIRMVAEYLPRACVDGADREARAQMLLAAHIAGIAMATTGLGACHAIGHSLGGRFDIPHGIALTMVLPQVLSFSRPACDFAQIAADALDDEVLVNAPRQPSAADIADVLAAAAAAGTGAAGAAGM